MIKYCKMWLEVDLVHGENSTEIRASSEDHVHFQPLRVINHCHTILLPFIHHLIIISFFRASSPPFSLLTEDLQKKLEATKRNRWTHWKDELLEKIFTKQKIGLRKETKKIRDLITQWTSKSWWVKTYYTSALLPFLLFFVSLSLHPVFLFLSLSLSSSLPFLDTRPWKEWGNRK